MTASNNNGFLKLSFMSLEDQVRLILKNFETVSSEKILESLDLIKPEFKSQLTSEYVDGKIQKIRELSDESEKKKQCKALIPYFDWYVQGL